MIGKTLAHYEITSQLGKGGMGEVFQATDKKLGREVAIKVLPEEFVRDQDRVARFQREAKLLASLNHPNIATIHGLEESDGAGFLVLELVEGETLADRLKRGPIPVEESLELALQIAEALEAAHENGVIHRDLKPANIKITPESKIKVLDFGLAKAFVSEQAEMVLSDSPTLSVAATQKGIILGTAAYMSPEQAKGKTVDKRADIWAFGVVLFEMMTGKPAFQGEDISEVLASVIKADSNLALLPANMHTRIREVLTRCLQKDIRKRYADIADARYEIEQVLADPDGIYVQATGISEHRQEGKKSISWIAAVLVLTAVIAGLAGWILKPEPVSGPLQTTRLSHILPKDHQRQGRFRSLTISPDGKNIVYSTTDGLYLRRIDAFNSVPIHGTEKNSLSPFFSPNGQWVGYLSPSNRQLKKISINGGSPVVLCDQPGNGGGSWDEDNRILFASENGISQVSGDGGVPELLINKQNDYLWFPQMLPGGKSVLFTLGFSNRIAVQSLESGKFKQLMPGVGARYIPTGHLVYFIDNSLYVVKFDPEALEVIGGPVPLVSGVDSADNLSSPLYAVSKTGTLVYVPGSPASSEAHLEWFDRRGDSLGQIGEPGPYEQFSLSPDETRVVIEKRTSDGYDLWVLELNRGGVGSPITFDPGNERDPIWSHDGKFIIFNANRNGLDDLYKISLTTEEEVELLADPEIRMVAEDCSDDGHFLAYGNSSAQEGWIRFLSLLDDQTPEPVVKGDFTYDEPKFSPDVKWMAYVSSESGDSEVFMVSLEGERIKHRVSTQGGGQPQWKGDGKELYYLAPDGSMMAVDLKGERLTPGDPKLLFKTNLLVTPDMDQYAVSADGLRFLILKSEENSNASAINIVLNWFEELKQKVPVP